MDRGDRLKVSDKASRLYRNVIEALRKEIESGSLKVGDRLPSEKLLVERFAVSRLTVREAVIGLEILGLVESRQGAGVFVQESGPGRTLNNGALDIGPVELIEARRIVEVQTAALAALEATEADLNEMRSILSEMTHGERAENDDEWVADRKFHLPIARASQTHVLFILVEALWDMRRRSPISNEMLERIANAGQAPRLIDHQRIFEAIEKRDPAAARRAMRSHLDRVMNDLLHFTELEAMERVSAEIAARREMTTRRADV